MKTIPIWAVPVMGAAVLAVPMPARAHDQDGAGGGGPTPAMIARMHAREADDTALLLNLRTDQRPVLMAFLASMTPPPPPWLPMHSTPGQGGPALDEPRTMPPADGFARQLDRMTQDVARRSAEDAKRIAAARTFYESLDPAQRRAFEALMRLRRERGPGFGPVGAGPFGAGGGGPRPPMGSMPPRP
ncbi:MAG: hypothetical protein V4595_10780 [Pseudomonadota bacterium]|jgi:hypothetical protein